MSGALWDSVNGVSVDWVICFPWNAVSFSCEKRNVKTIIIWDIVWPLIDLEVIILLDELHKATIWCKQPFVNWPSFSLAARRLWLQSQSIVYVLVWNCTYVKYYMKIEVFFTTVMEIFSICKVFWQKCSRLKAYEILYQRHQSKEILLNNIWLVSRSRVSSYLWAILCSY